MFSFRFISSTFYKLHLLFGIHLLFGMAKKVTCLFVSGEERVETCGNLGGAQFVCSFRWWFAVFVASFAAWLFYSVNSLRPDQSMELQGNQRKGFKYYVGRPNRRHRFLR